jgi:hypothetical protein
MPITGEVCIHPIDGTVDLLTFDGLVAANVAAMGPSDWAALLFATSIAALAVVGELKVRRVLSVSSLSRIFPSDLFCPWPTMRAWCNPGYYAVLHRNCACR